ncbi:hypothetical protein [Vallitalea maricola]|uniref:Uncharacterized protein n=1 Tax=Vallitalea maricola TaxID=3074433 RepID=A0ACB5UD26_9FIRM|nr:hypothetical protein AN2V17_00700 [Vallitalea sp. AN17-2]
MKRLREISVYFLMTVLLCTTTCVYASSDDLVKPEVAKVMGLEGNRVEITFNEELDKTTVEDISNYTIFEKYGSKEQLQVLEAELDDTKTKVIITTEKQKSYILYDIYISGIADLSGNVMDNNHKVFIGLDSDNIVHHKDFDIVSVNPLTNKKIKVTFNKKINKYSAENLTNYIIKEKYGVKPVLKVIDAELDSTGYVVTLTTEELRGSILYSIVINNLMDPSEKIFREVDALFVGVSSPVEFVVENVECTSNDTVEITFNFELNEQTIHNMSYYEIGKKYGDKQKVEVFSATLSSDSKKIILKTDVLEPNYLYELKAQNVISVWGNVLEPVTKCFVGR